MAALALWSPARDRRVHGGRLDGGALQRGRPARGRLQRRRGVAASPPPPPAVTSGWVCWVQPVPSHQRSKLGVPYGSGYQPEGGKSMGPRVEERTALESANRARYQFVDFGEASDEAEMLTAQAGVGHRRCAAAKRPGPRPRRAARGRGRPPPPAPAPPPAAAGRCRGSRGCPGAGPAARSPRRSCMFPCIPNGWWQPPTAPRRARRGGCGRASPPRRPSGGDVHRVHAAGAQRASGRGGELRRGQVRRRHRPGEHVRDHQVVAPCPHGLRHGAGVGGAHPDTVPGGQRQVRPDQAGQRVVESRRPAAASLAWCAAR